MPARHAPVQIREKHAADQRRMAAAPKAGFDALLADALLAEGATYTPSFREQLMHQPGYGNRDNIEDRRDERTGEQLRTSGALLENVPHSPYEADKYMARLADLQQYKARTDASPVGQRHRQVAAPVMQAVDPIEDALARLRSKLGGQ